MSLEQIRAFWDNSDGLAFSACGREELYGWMEEVLRQQGYGGLRKEGKGLIRSCLIKMSGLSRAQVTRLIGKYQASAEVKAQSYRRHRFRR